MKRRTLLKRAIAGSSGAGLLAGCVGQRDGAGGSSGDTDGTTTSEHTTTTGAPAESSDANGSTTDADNGSDADDGSGSSDSGEDDEGDDSGGGDGEASESGGDDDGGDSGGSDGTGDDSGGSDGTGDDSVGGDGVDDDGSTGASGSGADGAPLADGVLDRETDSGGRCLEAGESAGKAGVTFEGDSVVVSGAFETPDPCFFALVAESSYRDGVYEVAVEPHERTDENGDPVVCQQCVGIMEYETTVRFEDPPDRVVVKHGPETVADESR